VNHVFKHHREPLLTGFLAVLLVCVCSSEHAHARVRLESICTVLGQKEIKLTGLGLVVGLKGTGDGGDNLPAMRSLAAALKLMNSPVLALSELRDADNVAIVMIEATIPKSGLRKGQRIDCYVSSMMSAKSLRGGRLLVAPLETAEIGNDTVVGLASGAIDIEDTQAPTSGLITGGVVLEEDFISRFIDTQRGNVITLLLDSGHSSFHAASEVARVVNAEFSFENQNQRLARATGPGVVEVKVPQQYYDEPVEFVAQVLEIGIDNPHTQARVIANTKTGTIIVTGEVEISPVIVTHQNLLVEIGPPVPGQTNRFVELTNQQNTQQLKSLITVLNQLKVPKNDAIHIIRELHRSGKLHAVYEEH